MSESDYSDTDRPNSAEFAINRDRALSQQWKRADRNGRMMPEIQAKFAHHHASHHSGSYGRDALGSSQSTPPPPPDGDGGDGDGDDDDDATKLVSQSSASASASASESESTSAARGRSDPTPVSHSSKPMAGLPEGVLVALIIGAVIITMVGVALLVRYRSRLARRRKEI